MPVWQSSAGLRRLPQRSRSLATAPQNSAGPTSQPSTRSPRPGMARSNISAGVRGRRCWCCMAQAVALTKGDCWRKRWAAAAHASYAVSRFGYLGSELPADPSTAAQAEAFLDLLDHLGIERASILAMSGGVPPALKFAEMFPDRTDRLVLLSPLRLPPSAPWLRIGPFRLGLYHPARQ